MGTTRDKSNVLARLCRSATTDYFLFTSADMALGSAWVHTMLGAAAPGGGVVTSSTMAGGNLFGRLQNIGWLFSLSLIRVLTDAGVPVTTVGNNMLVTRAAYASVCDFAALAFSTTEDLQMFAQTVAPSWIFRNLMAPHALGISVPQPTVRHLLRSPGWREPGVCPGR